MIQITRLLAKQLRSVFKKTIGRQGPALVLTFRSGDDGLFIEAQGTNQALQYHDPQPQDREHLLVPLNVLEDVQGAKAEPVYLNTRRAGVLGASWQDKGMFRDLEFDAPEPVADAKPFPAMPTQLAENPPTMLAALRDAYETTDIESNRYALGSIQIRGSDGVIAATDGRQMLKLTGFTFGFDDELLVSHTKFFANKELPDDQPIRVGKSGGKTVVFQVGHWSYWIGVADGRFPDIDRIIPSTQYSNATLQLNAADAKFMVDNLHRLPNGVTHRELTLDLNGFVILRASSPTTPRPAEIVLRNSRKQGADVRICTDRKFLARAAEMGFSEIHLPDNAAPAVARDATRTFLWMLLDPKEAIKPTDDCLRIESPFDFGPRASATATRKETPVNRISSPPPAPVNPPVSAAIAPAQPVTHRKTASSASKLASALDQAIIIRNQLRTTITAVKDLIRTINIEKRSQKSLKLALASLKQLQNVA